MSKNADAPAEVEPELAYTFGDLRSKGLLWLINASVFHPRGLALALVYEECDPEHRDPVGWRLVAAGPGEPFTFADSPEVDECFRQAEHTMHLATEGLL